MWVPIALLALPLATAAPARVPPDTVQLPTPLREFRGLWVATVDNMDWPSRPGLTTSEQQSELLAIIDRAAALKMNAIVLQVRPEADALYESKYEPWSRYLTGKQGRAPSPAWDPLQFAIHESHARGIELHAWFNPYRAAFHRDSTNSRTHVSRRRPWLVVPYAQYLWINPGSAEARRLFIRVVRDVVRRYDVDGVHIDDYFYPYPEVDAARRRINFADAKAYVAYRRRGGERSKADWRRHNVNLLVRELYATVKDEKKWVKVGISPFGIWRPGVPPTTTAGLDQYDELYADPRRWLRDGVLDYVAPQLYWPVRPPEQSYPVLLKWWLGENVQHRHVWPGLALYKLPISGPRRMNADDIVEEIDITRSTEGATGHVLFSARQLMENADGIGEKLAQRYTEPALVPGSPWLGKALPAKPSARLARDSASGVTVLRITPATKQRPRQWLVRSRNNSEWRTTLLPGSELTHILKDEVADGDIVSVSAVDRTGNVSEAVLAQRQP